MHTKIDLITGPLFLIGAILFLVEAWASPACTSVWYGHCSSSEPARRSSWNANTQSVPPSKVRDQLGTTSYSVATLLFSVAGVIASMLFFFIRSFRAKRSFA